MMGKNKKLKWLRKPGPRQLIILAVLVVAGLAWHWHNTGNAPSAETPASSTAKNIAPKKAALASPAPTKSQPAKSPTVSDVSNGHLSAPDRVTYVSNHNPSSSSDTQISTFVTTPGATGTITFNNGSVTKSLPAQIAPSNGTVTWYWKPIQIGLTSGSWQITAVTSLGGQTKSSTDVINLVIP